MTDIDFEEIVYDFEKPKHNNYVDDEEENEYSEEELEDEELTD